jgi:hypothetical protein
MFDREMITKDCTFHSVQMNLLESLDTLSDRLMINSYRAENNSTSILLNVNNIDAQLRVSLTCGRGAGHNMEQEEENSGSYFSQVSDKDLLIDIKNFGFNAQLAYLQDSNATESTSSNWGVDDIKANKSPYQAKVVARGLELLNIQASYEGLSLNSTVSPLLAQFILLCPQDGQEKEGTLCYPKCKDGFVGIQNKCIQSCADGFQDIGDACLKPLPEFRGFGYALWDFDKCSSHHHETSCELCLLMYFPKCRSGFHAIGTSNCDFCRSDCSNGQRDTGHSCEKIKYDRGIGVSGSIDRFIQIWIEENQNNIQEYIQNNITGLNNVIFEQLNKLSFSWYGVDMKLCNTNMSQPLLSQEPEISEKYIQVQLEGGLDYDDDHHDSTTTSPLLPPANLAEPSIDQSGGRNSSNGSSIQLTFSESILNDAFNLLLGSGVIKPMDFKGKFNTLFSVKLLSGELEFNEMNLGRRVKDTNGSGSGDNIVKGGFLDSYFVENNNHLNNNILLRSSSDSKHDSTMTGDNSGAILLDSVQTETSDLISSSSSTSSSSTSSSIISLYMKASVKVTSNKVEYTVPASVLLDMSITTDSSNTNVHNKDKAPGVAVGAAISGTISNVKLNLDCDAECEQCKISQMLLRSFQEIMDDLINDAYDSEMGENSIDIKLPIFPFLSDSTLLVNKLTIHFQDGLIQVGINNKSSEEQDKNNDDFLLRGGGVSPPPVIVESATTTIVLRESKINKNYTKETS